MMIRALVEEHKYKENMGQETQVDDFVPDKGRGLVMLFHGEQDYIQKEVTCVLTVLGPPGTGKTVSRSRTGQQITQKLTCK